VSRDGRFVFEEDAETSLANVTVNWFAAWPRAVRP